MSLTVSALCRILHPLLDTNSNTISDTESLELSQQWVDEKSFTYSASDFHSALPSDFNFNHTSAYTTRATYLCSTSPYRRRTNAWRTLVEHHQYWL